MTTDALQRRHMTGGEKLVLSLARKLPEDRFYYAPEPVLNEKGVSRRPDGVMVCLDYGIAIVEIKDWSNLKDASQKTWKISRGSGLETVESPVEQARGYARTLAHLLEAENDLMSRHNGRRKLNLPWQEMVILPNISQSFISHLESLKMIPENVVFGMDCLYDPAAFERAFAKLPWEFKLESRISDGQYAAIRRFVNPSLKVGEHGTLSPLQEFLSQEALSVAESSNVRLVRGVAGSGKSLVLVRRAQWIKEEYPDQQILVMNFNKDLTADLKKRIDRDGITVVNFHKFCVDIIKQANRSWRSPNNRRGWLERYASSSIKAAKLTIEFVDEEIKWRKNLGLEDNETYLTTDRKGRGTALPRDKREIINQIWDNYRAYQDRQKNRQEVWEDWEDVPYLALDALDKKTHPYRDAFDIILLDEAQDFAPTWMKVVVRLLKPGGTLFLCDDPAQSIFGYFSWQEKGIPVRGRTRILRIPFRSTREISKAAHALIEADPILSMSSDITQPLLDSDELMSGKLPTMTRCRSRDEEMIFVLNKVAELLNEGVPAHDIAILVHDSKYRQWDIASAQGVQIKGFHTMKGLEYRAVFIPFVNVLFEPDSGSPDASFVSDRRKELFTAMTRARLDLIMSYHGKFPKELDCLREFTFRDHADETF